MSQGEMLFRSTPLAPETSGRLLDLARDRAGWQWMSFVVHRLVPGDTLQARTEKEEAAFVLLGGSCHGDWGQGPHLIGKRCDVFDGLPYTLYLPAHREVKFRAETMCEIAESRVPSEAALERRLVTPASRRRHLGGGSVGSKGVGIQVCR